MQAKVLEFKSVPRFYVSNLAKVRAELGFSLQEVADLVGISKSYLSDIEKGRKTVPAHTAEKLSQCINTLWESRQWRTKKSLAKKS